ncbi:MAG TPA: hypothetical protein VGN14_06715 [Candidatus Elarobacter sp.]
MLTWEALSALASLFSSVAVLAAVIVALRQVRVGAEQVEHLRRATQLEGTMKVFAMMASPEQEVGRRFIRLELAERMNDPRFRADAARGPMAPVPGEHPEFAVLRLMEMVGTYVKHGLLDEEIVFDYWVPPILSTWRSLEASGIIGIHRASLSDALWENFEHLYHRAAAYSERRGQHVFVGALTPPPAAEARPAEAAGE